ncbi:hypothetical protein CASFOL_042089 [Castilleja foliolosa]|uniref:Uncharacterized protein n=1 Tax=Castilleja foliolosa TaxID=1961234 RepID=A0ABD3B9H8_9LAMI
MMVTSEDEDWADSCFTKDPDMLNSSWDSLKDALLETLNTQNTPSPYNDSTEASKTETMLPEVGTDDDRDLFNTSINSNTTATINSDDFWLRHRMEDIFLPMYGKTSRELDSEVDFVFQSVELEQSKEDIFKIWDLEIRDKEDNGLLKELDKALVESSLDPISPVSGDDESLDDLISGIADLALSPNLG